MGTSTRRIEELTAEATYHRDRFELYKAKITGSRPTSSTRLLELERRHQSAEARLRRVLSEDDPERMRGDGRENWD